jgi:hypothetical protein
LIANQGIEKAAAGLVFPERREEFWEITQYLLETESRSMEKILEFAMQIVALERTVV